jgi:hypothetical protein
MNSLVHGKSTSTVEVSHISSTSEPNLPFESDSFLDAVTKGLTEVSEGKLTSLEDTKKKLDINE